MQSCRRGLCSRVLACAPRSPARARFPLCVNLVRHGSKRGHDPRETGENQLETAPAERGLRIVVACYTGSTPTPALRALIARLQFSLERIDPMAKNKHADSVYRIVDVVGVSDKSWEDAGRRAIETAAGSLRDLRVAEVTKMDMKVENGKVTAFRTRVALSFKYET